MSQFMFGALIAYCTSVDMLHMNRHTYMQSLHWQLSFNIMCTM